MSAGAVAFQATLKMRSDEEMPSDPVLGDPAPGARYYALVRDLDPFSATLRISCEIRALRNEQLTTALDTVLRSVTAHAALTEAVLETSAVRLAYPSAPPASLVEDLARQLGSAGFRFSFGPSWTPLAGTDVSVGTQGMKDAFEVFLRDQSAWKLISR